MRKLKDFTSLNVNVSELMTAKQMNEINGGDIGKELCSGGVCTDGMCTNGMCTGGMCTNHLCSNSWGSWGSC